MVDRSSVVARSSVVPEPAVAGLPVELSSSVVASSPGVLSVSSADASESSVQPVMVNSAIVAAAGQVSEPEVVKIRALMGTEKRSAAARNRTADDPMHRCAICSV